MKDYMAQFSNPAVWDFMRRVGSGTRAVLGGRPVISRLDHHDVLIVCVGHEDQVFVEIVQVSMPSGIVRLS